MQRAFSILCREKFSYCSKLLVVHVLRYRCFQANLLGHDFRLLHHAD